MKKVCCKYSKTHTHIYIFYFYVGRSVNKDRINKIKDFVVVGCCRSLVEIKIHKFTVNVVL